MTGLACRKIYLTKRCDRDIAQHTISRSSAGLSEVLKVRSGNVPQFRCSVTTTSAPGTALHQASRHLPRRQQASTRAGAASYSSGRHRTWVNPWSVAVAAREFGRGTRREAPSMPVGKVKLVYSQVLDSIVHRGYWRSGFSQTTRRRFPTVRICRKPDAERIGDHVLVRTGRAASSHSADNQGGGLDVQGGVIRHRGLRGHRNVGWVFRTGLDTPARKHVDRQLAPSPETPALPS
jgi:hypothetical protein